MAEEQAIERPDARADEPAPRPDDDDYDLLTYGEAGARLVENIAAERRRLDDLRAGPATGDTEGAAALAAAIAAAEARVAALEDARARLDGNRIDDSTFFGPGGWRRS